MTLRNTKTVTVLPGDGIGPEIIGAVRKVVDHATGGRIIWDEQLFGKPALKETGYLVPPSTLASVRRNGAAIKGPGETLGHASPNLLLRKELGLHTNMRPVKTVPGVKTFFSGVPIDMIIFRENVGGEYSVVEEKTPRGAKGTFEFTLEECRNIAETAYRTAHKLGRKAMIIGVKSNIMPENHGLLERIALEVGEQYPDITTTRLLADNLFAQPMLDPTWFDCVVTTNLTGDYFSEMAAGMVGGVGYVGCLNIGDHAFVAESIGGTAPDIVGQGIANPTAALISGCLMLEQLEMSGEAARIRSALASIIEAGTFNAPKGRVTSTDGFTNAVIERLG